MYTAREEAANKLIETEKNLANITLESITDAVEYYKKTVKELVDIIDKKIEKIKNLEQQRSKYVEVLDSFE